MNFNSRYYIHANQNLEWLPTDTKELYEINLKNRYGDLESNGWLRNKFLYEFNSLGFRCPEFTNEPSIMFLGCSNTIGIGMPYDLIWPTLICRELKMSCVNLGIGGAGPDTSFRMCLGYIDKIKPKIVIHMLSPPNRFEFVEADKIEMVSCHSDNDLHFYTKLFADGNNFFFNQQKNRLAIKMLCSERHIKFLEITDEMFDGNHEPTLARDLGHVGINEHRAAYKNILKLL